MKHLLLFPILILTLLLFGCSGGAHREVPEMEAGALVQDGHLFLYAPTNVELSDVVDRFIRDMLNAEVPNIISNRRIGWRTSQAARGCHP